MAASAPANVVLRAAPDAFSMLASAGPRPNSSRPITPSTKRTPVTSKNDTTAGDAFGGLVSFDNPTSLDGGLTIAERAAKAERERKERTEKDEVTFNVQGSFWDKFESLPTGEPLISDAHVKSNGLLDLDFFTEPPRTSTPGSFDFGDREDQLLGAIDSQDEGDISGSLAKPVVNGINPKVCMYISKEEHILSYGFPLHKPPPVMSPSRTLSPSPPPHILGRIVEMGFSVQQAKDALAATLTGLDVDAALEILLQHGGSALEERGGEAIESTNLAPISRRRQASSRPPPPPAHSSPSSPPSDSPLTNQQGLQEQADKLLAHASMIGRTVFSRANAFWKESREQVGKAYQDQRSGLAAEAGIGKGRPKWMDNARVGEDGNELLVDESRHRLEIRRIPIQPSRSAPDPQRSEPPVSLVANDDPVYISPARRRQPAKTPSKPLSPSPISTSTTLPLIVRASVEASPSALAASGTHKAEATEHFKLGRFAEAEAAYSRAIDALPASHLLRIPLYNNRALTRLRTGEYKGTINDTTEVIHLITEDVGTAWHPGKEQVGVRETFGDAIGKALRRRAEAYEGLEKWKDAVVDWEWLSAATWVGLALKRDAIKGAGRCGQLARDGSTPPMSLRVSPQPQPRFQSKFTPTRNSLAHHSEAVIRVRAANTALEKEDQARHDLKDVVDARLAAWRTGKENNLRALIASLDTILSPTFRWKTVGMSELVSPEQVKTKYTKAIAKLHPDKVR